MPSSHGLQVTLVRLVAVLPLLAVVAIVPAIGSLVSPTEALAGQIAPAPCVTLSVFHAADFQHDNGEPAPITNQYFPLEPGTTFVYRGSKDGQAMRNVTHVTRQVKTILGIPTVEVHDQVYIDRSLEEDTFDWYAQDKKGNVWYFGEDSTDVATGDTTGSWEAGVHGAKPGIIMEASPKAGDRYMQEFAPKDSAEDKAEVVGFVKTLSVPYGRFNHVLKTKEGSCVERGDEFKFYAAGVGNIKVQSLGRDGKPDGVEQQSLVSVTKGDPEGD